MQAGVGQEKRRVLGVSIAKTRASTYFHVSMYWNVSLGGCQAGEVQCGAVEECISVGNQKY